MNAAERQKLSIDAERAGGVLARRIKHLYARAARSRLGSNEWRKCVEQAKQLVACATAISSNRDLQQRVSPLVELGAGWQRLAEEVAEWAREQERKRKALEAAHA